MVRGLGIQAVEKVLVSERLRKCCGGRFEHPTEMESRYNNVKEETIYISYSTVA